MEIEFWQQRWQDNQTGFHLDQVNPCLTDFWSSLGLHNSAEVLVPMCGKSLDMVWLSKQGHKILGVECSEKALNEFFSEQSLPRVIDSVDDFQSFKKDNYNLLLGDFFKLEKKLLSGVAAVYDRASLVALPENMRRNYVNLLINNLPKNVSILLITLDYDQSKMSGPPFSLSNEEVHSLYSGDFNISLLNEVDVLSEQPRFKERGLTYMIERVYKIVRES